MDKLIAEDPANLRILSKRAGELQREEEARRADINAQQYPQASFDELEMEA